MSDLDKMYQTDIKIREKCVLCGKPLKPNEGLFKCDECKQKELEKEKEEHE